MTVTTIKNLTPYQASYSRHAKASKRIKKRIWQIARREGMPAMDVVSRIKSDDRNLDEFRMRTLKEGDLKYFSTARVAKMVDYAVI